MNATAEQTLNQIKAMEARFHDTYVPLNKLQYRAGHLQWAGKSVPLTLTACRRMAQARLGIPTGTFDYLFEGHKQEWENVMKRVWSQVQETYDKPYLLRLWESPQGLKVRGVLTERYGVIRMSKVAEEFLQNPLVEGEGARVAGAIDPVTGDSMVKLRLPFEEQKKLREVGDPHAVQLVLKQNDLGYGRNELLKELLRLICTNGMVAPDAVFSVNQRHIGEDAERRMIQKVQEAQTDFRLNAGEWDRYFDTKEIAVNIDNVWGNLTRRFAELGKRMVPDLEKRASKYIAEMGPNAYAIINAITEEARDNKEKREELQALAGKLSFMSPEKLAKLIE